MPEYLAPAVYVEEVDTGSKPIEGVSTSTAGFLGVSERGPVNVPILITSNGEFVRWFGGQLNRVDFGEHSYLPHAVEGFFTNGGKRVYVVRVLDTQLAAAASAAMFDRSMPAPFGNTLLLRAANEGTGSAANPPPLVVLPDAALAQNDWVRIGDGSNAEYRQIAALPAVETVLVPLHLPLGHAHGRVANNAQQFTRAAAGGALDLVTGANAGSQALTVAGAAADVNALNAANILIEIGGTDGEYRFVSGFSDATPLAGGQLQARVALDAPLALSYAAAAGLVQRITVPAPGAPQATVTPAIRSGDSLLFVDNRGANFNNRARLVLLDGSLPEREVRRIGELRRATISSAAAATYDAGSLVQAVTLGDDARVELVAPAPGAGTNALNVNDIRPFRAGQNLLVGPAGGPYERVTVQAVAPGAAPAGTITLAPVLAAGKGVNDLVLLERTLLASPRAGAMFLALSDRSGLAVGDVLRVSDGVAEDFVEIAGLPNPVAVNVWPDPGNVVLTAPLGSAFDRTITRVIRQNTATVVAAIHPTCLALTAAAGDTAIYLSDGTGYAGQSVRVQTPEGGRFYHRVTTLGNIISPNPAAGDEAHSITLDVALERSHPVGSPLIERRALFDVQALDPGAWGNRLRIAVEDEPTGLVASTRFRSVTNATRAHLASTAGIESGSLLELYTLADGQAFGPPVKVATVNRGNGEVTFDAASPLTPAQMGAVPTLAIRSREFRLSVFAYAPIDPAAPTRTEPTAPVEVFRHLSMDHRHSRYFQDVIGDIGGVLRLSDHRPEGESWYIRVHDRAQDLAEPQRTQGLESLRYGPELLIDVLPDGRERAARRMLEGGDDAIATLTDAHYVGVDDVNPENRTGLQSLRNVEEISIVACPGRSSPVIQNALINHCELLRYRFAVLDGQRTPADTIADIQNQRQQFDTKYAALYHPWLLIPDPFRATPNIVADYPIPPSGHMVGIYARTDIERGVHKAPANEVVRGIIGLQRILNKEQHDILNPYPVNINVIRDFRLNNRGIRVFGGRVITSDSDWKYVNVRRLLIFIEASIDRGLQWVVFEPNAEPLWARVRRSITNFLTLVWRNGGLEGAKVEEAFFVKCDRTTMMQTDIDSGRLICVVGVAPVKPAEFVIVRIGLWTAHADE